MCVNLLPHSASQVITKGSDANVITAFKFINIGCAHQQLGCCACAAELKPKPTYRASKSAQQKESICV